MINSTCVNHLVYADDIVLLAPSPGALQGLIDTAAKYFVDNGLMINRKKTKCMTIIPLCNKEIHIPSFYVHGTTISRVHHKNYLGCTISDDLNDNQAIIKEKRGIYARGNMLHGKFKAYNNEVKKKLFVSYCTSLYCSALWSTYASKRVMEEIHIAHNDVYRLLFKLPRGFFSVSQHFVTAGIPNFTTIRRRHMYSLYKRILSSSNVIINAITDSFTFICIHILCMRNGGENYFKLICLCIPIPCLFFMYLVYFVVCSMDLCMTIKHYYYHYYLDSNITVYQNNISVSENRSSPVRVADGRVVRVSISEKRVGLLS